MANPTPTELSASAGISVSYASEILSGTRKPSRALALRIYEKAGLKFGPLANLTAQEIEFLAGIQDKAA